MRRLWPLPCLMAIALCACSPPKEEWHWEELALSAPDHVEDWYRFYEAIQKTDVRCMAGPSSMGTLALDASSTDFNQARQISLNIIKRDALSLRLRKSMSTGVFEIYEYGKKVREEPR